MNKTEIKNWFINNIKLGKITKVKLYGSSMLPAISSDSTVEITNKFNIKIGDILVANSSEKPVLVIHKVIDINKKNNRVCLRGDNEEISQSKWFDIDDIIAKVINIYTPIINETDKLNIVVDLPFAKPKSFSARCFEIYQALINDNLDTFYFDYNIDFNIELYGKEKIKNFKAYAKDEKDFFSFNNYMSLVREIAKKRYNLDKITFSNIVFCDPTDDNKIKKCIKNYKQNILYEFYFKKINEIKKFLKTKKITDNFNEKINIYVSIENFNKLISAIIFAKVLKDNMDVEPILVDNSTLFNSNYNTDFINIYFKKIIPGYIISKNINNLNTDYSQIDFDKYLFKTKSANIRIMHECYYKQCKFCDRHGKDNFCFPVQNIYEKISNLSSLGVNNIVFEDDCLVPQQIFKLLNLLKNKGIKIRWQGTFRFDSILNDEKYIKFFNENGCKLLFFGLESFSQNQLNRMNKGIRIKDIIGILKKCKKFNIKTCVSFLFNFPNETLFDLQQTKNNFIKYNKFIDNCEFNFFLPTKNCKLSSCVEGTNYFLKPEEINPSHQEIISQIINLANSQHKTNSFYLKNYLCWEDK